MIEPLAHVPYEGRDYPVFDCGLCGMSLYCPKCGNNACNGGYGEVDGVECDVCPTVYDAQDANSAALAAMEEAPR